MIKALKSLAALLIAVSLLLGAEALAHGVADGAHAGAEFEHGADHADEPACQSCDVQAEEIEPACAATTGHCSGAALQDGGGWSSVSLGAGRGPQAPPTDLILNGAGPESDTPPPRA